MATREPPAFAELANCKGCNTAFSLFNRKHHCRNCGQTFCGKCSPYNISLPHFGLNDPVRVCGPCYQAQSASGGKSAPPKPVSADDDDDDRDSPRNQRVADAPSKKVSNCTCNSPLCVCPPDAAEETKAAPQAAAQPKKPAATPVRAVQQAQYEPTGVGFFKPQSVEYNMSGDLNDQCRDAIKAGDFAGVQKLLAAGANAKYCDRTGNSLLHLAAMFNRLDMVELLVSKGASVTVKNADNETPIDLAPPALQFKMNAMAKSS